MYKQLKMFRITLDGKDYVYDLNHVVRILTSYERRKEVVKKYHQSKKGRIAMRRASKKFKQKHLDKQDVVEGESTCD